MSHGEVSYNRSPVNGRYLVGTMASFSCNYGYTRSGSASRTCQTSANWNGEMPTCSQSIKPKIKIMCWIMNYVNIFGFCKNII